MQFSEAAARLVTGKSLKQDESRKVFSRIFQGDLSEQKVKTLLALLAAKGETAEEVYGCLQALRMHEPSGKTGISGLTDTCGTGGDKSYSLNISTLAALAAAGAGCRIAKHGNRAFSSKCGSSDLLEAFGFNVKTSRNSMLRSIRKNRIGYFHAPAHHPALARFQQIRRQLGIKTLFNLLGPLANPLDIDAQLVGVSSARAFNLYVSIMKKSAKRALVIYGDGLDEISCSSPTLAAWIEKGKARIFEIDYKKAGLRTAKPSALKSMSLKDSKRRCEKILRGREKGPVLDVVLINAGAALWIAGQARTLGQGIELARKSIQAGKAYQALKGLVAESRK